MHVRWSTRKYARSDDKRVLRLFKLIFGKKLTKDYMDWLHRNPAGPIIGEIAEDDHKLVGYYSLIPFKLKVKENVITAALSVSSMTHPDYRGQGIFVTLARKAYEDAGRKGIKFICGFPNRASYPIFIKKLRWFDICSMPLLEKPLSKDLVYQPSSDGIKIVRVHSFEKSNVNYFWEKVSEDYPIIRVREREYLQWRYSKLKMWGDKPPREYSIYLALDGKQIIGYLVLKTFEDEKMKKTHIVDVLTLPDKKQAFYLFISEAVKYAKAGGRDLISCWMLKSSEYFEILKKLGFREKIEIDAQPFGGCVNSPELSIKILKNPHNWYVTMGDSDVF